MLKLLTPVPPITHQRSDFEFQRKIGDGAFGQVWRVRDKKSSKLLAIKQITKQKISKIIDQLNRELSILYSIDHPYIVKLYSHFEDEKFIYMIMELVEGGTLFNKLIKDNIFSEKIAAQYLRELVLAIEYLHTRNPPIMHRDIKPENILIDKDGKIKLADFGWANYVTNNEERHTSCGTLEYLPPEMLGVKAHDTCADIWCLGVLLYEMLTGTTPFKAAAKERIMNNIATAALQFPLGFSHIAKDLIQGMLEKDKSKRLNIFQIKAHRWFIIIQPIRETLVQNLAPKKPVEHEKSDEVTTAYSDTDTDEETKTSPNKAFRKSIKDIKKNFKMAAIEVKSQRASLKENCKEYFNLCQVQRNLEEKIKEKEKEILRVKGNVNEMLARCFDMNLELERLQTYDRATLSGQISDMHRRIGEMQKFTKLQQIYLESLKSQVKTSSQVIIDHDKGLKTLHKHLQELKNSSSTSSERKQSSIYDLKINVDVLKSQIRERSHVIINFTEKDQNIAKEISEMISSKIENRKSLNRDLTRKVEDAEEMVNEKEQQISELTIEYEMKKSQKLHFLRKKKDEFSRQMRKLKEEHRILKAKRDEEIRLDLKIRLTQVRKSEFFVEPLQIDKCRAKIDKIKETIERLEKVKKRKENEHKKNQACIEANKKTLNELEVQIGHFKCETLMENFLSPEVILN